MATNSILAANDLPGRIDIAALRVHSANARTKQPTGPVVDLPVREVAPRVLCGDRFVPVFQTAGGVTVGKPVRYTCDRRGVEKIRDHEEAPSGQRLQDLPRF